MKDQQPGGPWTTPRLGDDGVQVAPLGADRDPRVAMRAVDLQPVLGPGVADRAAITGLEAGRARYRAPDRGVEMAVAQTQAALPA